MPFARNTYKEQKRMIGIELMNFDNYFSRNPNEFLCSSEPKLVLD